MLVLIFWNNSALCEERERCIGARATNEHPSQAHHVSTLSPTPSPSPRTSQIAEAGVGAPNLTIASQGFLPPPQMTPVSPPVTLPLPIPTGSPQSGAANPTSSSSINASVPLVPTHQPVPVSPTTVPFSDSSVSLPTLNDSLDHRCTNPPASNPINSTASPTPTPQAAPTFTTTLSPPFFPSSGLPSTETGCLQHNNADVSIPNATRQVTPVSPATSPPSPPCSASTRQSEPDTPNPAACPDTQDVPPAAKWVCPLWPPPTFLSLHNLALPLKLQRKAIRNQRACVQWFKSTGNGSLQAPPEHPRSYDTLLCLADLYVHQDNCRHTFQVWMWSGHRWDPIKSTAPHPTLPGYCLKILDRGEPSWVTRKTMVSDQGRAKQRLFE